MDVRELVENTLSYSFSGLFLLILFIIVCCYLMLFDGGVVIV